MRCKVCHLEMEISRGQAVSETEYRQTFKCRNPKCEEHGKPVEVVTIKQTENKE